MALDLDPEGLLGMALDHLAPLLPIQDRNVIRRDDAIARLEPGALRRAAGTVFELLRARAARLRAAAELAAAEGDRRRAELDAWLLVSSLERAGASR